MKITTKERMVQITSSIDCAAYVISNYLLKNHHNILNEGVSKLSNTTVEDLLNSIRRHCKDVANADPHYFADLDIGYTEDNFPVEH